MRCSTAGRGVPVWCVTHNDRIMTHRDGTRMREHRSPLNEAGEGISTEESDSS